MGTTAMDLLRPVTRINRLVTPVQQTKSTSLVRYLNGMRAEFTLSCYRCLSYNCVDGTCRKATDDPNHPRTWVYAIVAVLIILCKSSSVPVAHSVWTTAKIVDYQVSPPFSSDYTTFIEKAVKRTVSNWSNTRRNRYVFFIEHDGDN